MYISKWLANSSANSRTIRSLGNSTRKRKHHARKVFIFNTHSCRGATIGSTFAARRAGGTAARTVTIASSRRALRMVHGSLGPTPKSWLAMRRPKTSAMGTVTQAPATRNRNPCQATPHTTFAPGAPKATRISSSRVRASSAAVTTEITDQSGKAGQLDQLEKGDGKTGSKASMLVESFAEFSRSIMPTPEASNGSNSDSGEEGGLSLVPHSYHCVDFGRPICRNRSSQQGHEKHKGRRDSEC